MAIQPSKPVVRYSCAAFGSQTIASEEVDAAFGMPLGKLRERAGIVSLARAGGEESEVTLGARAALQTLRDAECAAETLDWIIATSETHHAFPSLAAQLHLAIGAREGCGAL